ncbi:HEAT repeat domain-containing protein [Alcaligenes faecalis]|uniref:HEAT repeat domain-containing protein n=1 Tax=Alcaligenes faecalis TaxID=511 RepID=UPI003558BDDF
MSTETRKGYAKIADIPADVLLALSKGEIQAATLTESLAIDQRMLVATVFPELDKQGAQKIDALAELGILKRMKAIGEYLLETYGEGAWARCLEHPSDLVRGWACFMVGARASLSVPKRLETLRPLADDPHFGVREWAWMAVRPQLVAELDVSIQTLLQWARSDSEYLRRFACEVLRPRGVWCAHIAILKKEPERMLPILEILYQDGSVYVQDSVANYLNDAAKDQPQWVHDLCAQWQSQSPDNAAVQRLCRRALRNVS